MSRDAPLSAAAVPDASACDAADAGTVAWTRTFDAGSPDVSFIAGAVSGLVSCGDGLCLVSGNGLTKLTTEGAISWTRLLGDLYVAKFSADGAFIWQRWFGNPSVQSGPSGLAVAPEGNLVLDAETDNPLDLGQLHIDASKYGGAFVLGLDATGTPAFVTPFGADSHLGAQRGIVAASCRTFFAAGNLDTNFELRDATSSSNIFLLAGHD